MLTLTKEPCCFLLWASPPVAESATIVCLLLWESWMNEKHGSCQNLTKSRVTRGYVIVMSNSREMYLKYNLKTTFKRRGQNSFFLWKICHVNDKRDHLVDINMLKGDIEFYQHFPFPVYQREKNWHFIMRSKCHKHGKRGILNFINIFLSLFIKHSDKNWHFIMGSKCP